MKVKNKKNNNRIILSKRRTELKDEKTIYSTPNGPYKVVCIVSLGGECERHFTEYVSGNGRTFYSKKYKTNFLFRLSDGLPEFHLGNICRISDVVVFFTDFAGVDQERLRMIERVSSADVICVSNKKLKVPVRQFFENRFPKRKVVDISELLGALSGIRRREILHGRPYIVPTDVHFDGEHVYVNGYLRRGFLSDKVVVNGKYEMVIDEISADRMYTGAELNKSTESVGVVDSVEENEDAEHDRESKYAHDGFCEDGEDELKKNIVECEGSSLIGKYFEYKGMRNPATCNFRSHSFPKHYKELLLFDNFKKTEKLITSGESAISDNKMVLIKLKHGGCTDEVFHVVFGCYQYENEQTIYNFRFDSKEMIREEELVVDFGHKVVETRPVLTNNQSGDVFKRQSALLSGVISFIAPISFNFQKVLIYRRSALGDLSSNTYVSDGFDGFTGDRTIFEEVSFKGTPIKIKKKYCLVKYMFRTRDEVMYFRNIRLRVDGRKITGFIKKAMGTHGLFKGCFTRPVRHGDKILMCLYKRMFLKWPTGTGIDV